MDNKKNIAHWFIFGVVVLVSFGVIQKSVNVTSAEIDKVNKDIAQMQAVTGETMNKNPLLANTPASSTIGAPVNTNKQKTMEENKKITTAILKTNYGEIEIALREETPVTTANFIKLAQEGFYNGTRFHRVIQGFMIQGGDPLSKDVSMKSRWGTGGPEYKFKDEIIATDRAMPQGSLAMANAGPGTNGSQFFIVTAAEGTDFLLPKHTLFGKVTRGLDVALAIEKVETEMPRVLDRPVKDVIIEEIVLR